MPNDLAKQVVVLRQSSARLNKVTDDAQELVKSLETFLSETCSVGLKAYVAINNDGDSDANPDFSEQLEYRRIGEKFRIAYVVSVMGEDHSVKPWSDLDRKMKIETLPLIPELLKALTLRVDETIKQAEDALSSIRLVAAELNKK